MKTEEYCGGVMGWRFRKSFGFGPVRATVSRKGVGASWGVPGFHIGISPNGRPYVGIGIQGTGFCYIKYFGGRRG